MSLRNGKRSPTRGRPSPARSRTPNKVRVNASPSTLRRYTGPLSRKNMSLFELENTLKGMLNEHQYEAAAHWIQSSKLLVAKYEISDVIRLVLNREEYDLAGRLLREMSLSGNTSLVTLFITAVVHSGQFHLAFRYAKELVLGFEEEFQEKKTQGDGGNGGNATWTPQAMIQAMV